MQPSCTPEEPSSLIEAIALPLASAAGDTLFTALDANHCGIVFENRLEQPNVRKYFVNGAGTAIGDVDADGRPDVYLVSQDGENRLFRQTGTLQFEDVTDRAGVAGGAARGSGASFADVDDDGDLDLYVCNYDAPNLLYVNRGDGTFTEEAERRGVAYAGASMVGNFADYDRDGDLDLYLLNNRLFTAAEEVPKAKLRMVNGEMTVHPDFVDQYFVLDGHVCEAGQRDRLYRNDGDGTFTDITDTSGIDDHGLGLSATWWDFNADGWLDLYVGNDLKTPDRLYRNDGDGTFTDVLAATVPHTPWFAMGADSADLNGDGVLDLLVADMSSTTHYKQKVSMGGMSDAAWFLKTGRPRQFMRNALYLSTGSHRLLEASSLAGLDSTDWTWSVKFGDLDLDGRADVFVTNGIARNMNDADLHVRLAEIDREDPDAVMRLLHDLPVHAETNFAYRNLGGMRFEEVGAAWGLDHEGVSHGAAYADLDRDGDLDLIVNNMNEPAGIYRNDARGHRLLVGLRGTRSNRFGVGALVTIETEASSQVRRMTPVRGYISCDDHVVHFGLGDQLAVERLTVEWPSGCVQTLTDVAADQFVTITEPPEGGVPNEPLARIRPASPLFDDAAGTTGLTHRHAERTYDDFEREPLLPNQLSQLGPGLAWGDADGDGDDDLFVGGAAGQNGDLWLRDQSRFRRAPGPWLRDGAHEDMGVLWFDLEGDGDQDLYVVSGGVECEAGDPVLRDRIYVNTGAGSFEKAAEDALPDLRDSGSSVAAADFDQDGDLDLFVGSRVIPGRYPFAPTSRLLRNDAGRLRDVAEECAPGLATIGLVTGAVWTDVDDDSRVDLVVTCEWGPVSVFRNAGDGRLENATAAAGLAEHTGWWNGVAAGDVDGDGDLDLVATNFGLNHKYHASSEHPALLYASDFDRDGRVDLVEAEFEGESCFPIRGRSCSSAAMPFIREKFPTYHDFGLANLRQIYTDSGLAEAQRFAATRLETTLWLNDGTGRFTIGELPRIAQVAPSFGVELADWNGDGNLDLALAQNFFGPQPETGRMDGGLSQILLGDGAGSFTVLAAGDSGVVITGDATAMTRAHVDGDGVLDLIVACNDSELRVLRGNPERSAPLRRLRLVDRPGNPTAVGARVTIRLQDGGAVVREVTAGGGYLSQRPATVDFALPAGESLVEIRVRWADGVESVHAVEGIDDAELTIARE